ncbi:hypothetical protein SLEP1_g48742 [Rubroshorea leprosula]|uniref:Uncharacterized protein n=1 Tax=Rubroshorea leprosula TaxID=152421 RepID=A0AAV5LVQ0_9ROSI|nr:hypothetical protein SLEP1_g48742 [Rubroshorea leprosula]
MVEEFHFFCGPIKDGNCNSIPRLGYYEMLLWISVNNEEMIGKLCDYSAVDDNEDNLQLKDHGAEKISRLIFSYASCIPNIVVRNLS